MIDLPAHTATGSRLRLTAGRETVLGQVVLSVQKQVKGEWREVIGPHLAPHDARALAHALLELAGGTPGATITIESERAG